MHAINAVTLVISGWAYQKLKLITVKEQVKFTLIVWNVMEVNQILMSVTIRGGEVMIVVMAKMLQSNVVSISESFEILPK